MSKELYKVFKLGDRELCAYTLRGTFSGEEQETLELLAAENKCAISDIVVSIVKR